MALKSILCAWRTCVSMYTMYLCIHMCIFIYKISTEKVNYMCSRLLLSSGVLVCEPKHGEDVGFG